MLYHVSKPASDVTHTCVHMLGSSAGALCGPGRRCFCVGALLEQVLVMGKKNAAPVASNSASPAAKKLRGIAIPAVADMGTLSQGGGAKNKLVVDEKIHVGLYEYAKNGSVYSDFFGEGRLFVAQMATSRQPSPLYQARKLVEVYGASQREEEDPPPRTLDEVGFRFRAVNQYAGKKTDDRDAVGWVKGRMGWYIDENFVKEFFMYFDDMMAWRKDFQNEEFERIDDDIEIVIHMLKSSTLALELDPEEDELQCSFQIVREDRVFMSVFDLPPPVFPCRIVVLTFELLSPAKAHAVFSGNTKPFQNNFIQRSIKGTNVKLDPTDIYGEYFRVLEHVNLEDATTGVRVLTDIFEGCLQKSPVVVRMKETKYDTEQLKKVMAKFKDAEHIRIEI